MKIYEADYPYFLTSTFIKGLPLFADPGAAQIVLDSITFLQEQKKVTLYAYVLMENHFHLIAQHEKLSEIIRQFKSYTATELIKLFKQKKRTRLLKQLKYAKLNHKTESTHQVWQEGAHPKQIIGDKMMTQKIEYIHNNPVERGYVDQPENWRYSSVRNYIGMVGLIPVTLYSR